MLETSDESRAAVRLTFPVTATDAELTAMVLAGGAEALELTPGQAAELGLAVATESAGAMSRHSPAQSGEMSVELDFEPNRNRLRVTGAERTMTASTFDYEGPGWSASSRVDPGTDLVAEFAGSRFVRCILPRVLARVALSARAGLGTVTRMTVLGDRIADAVLFECSEPDLELRVHSDQESFEIAIRSSSERVLSAVAAAWPGAAETRDGRSKATLLLRTRFAAL